MKTSTAAVFGAALVAGIVVIAVVASSPEKKKPQRTPPPAPQRVPSPPPKEGSSLPYQLTGAGDVVSVDNLAALLPHVLDLAKSVKAGKFTSARDVLDRLVKNISNKPIRAVVLKQLPQMGEIPWKDVRAFAKRIPWGAVKPTAQAWLKSKGLA